MNFLSVSRACNSRRKLLTEPTKWLIVGIAASPVTDKNFTSRIVSKLRFVLFQFFFLIFGIFGCQLASSFFFDFLRPGAGFRSERLIVICVSVSISSSFSSSHAVLQLVGIFYRNFICSFRDQFYHRLSSPSRPRGKSSFKERGLKLQSVFGGLLRGRDCEIVTWNVFVTLYRILSRKATRYSDLVEGIRHHGFVHLNCFVAGNRRNIVTEYRNGLTPATESRIQISCKARRSEPFATHIRPSGSLENNIPIRIY